MAAQESSIASAIGGSSNDPSPMTQPNAPQAQALNEPAITLQQSDAAATPTIDTSAPVPDVLLSLAKDDRYISHISTLLAQSLVPLASVILPNRRSNTMTNEIMQDDGQRFVERIKPELHLVASILVHSATFVFYTRQFGDAVTNNKRGIKRSIGMESLNLDYDFPKSKRRASASTLSGRSRVKESMMRVLNSISIDRWQSLLLLQTIVPYLIQRAGRGGWSKDLGEILSSIAECCGFSSTRLGISSIDASINVRNDDRLRGSARRELFEAQRRRMMNADHSAGVENSSDGLRRDDGEQSAAGQTANSESGSLLVRRAKSVAALSWEFLRVRIARSDIHI